jgi:hypothetical protein
VPPAWKEWFAKGAATGVLGSPLLAGVAALVFRFPVPFHAYVSGPKGVWPAMMGSVFYGILGGFVVQVLLGGLFGVTGARQGWPVPRRMNRLCVLYALGGAEIGVLTLSVLDWMIGPW